MMTSSCRRSRLAPVAYPTVSKASVTPSSPAPDRPGQRAHGRRSGVVQNLPFLGYTGRVETARL